jgi:hypothetical protein
MPSEHPRGSVTGIINQKVDNRPLCFESKAEMCSQTDCKWHTVMGCGKTGCCMGYGSEKPYWLGPIESRESLKRREWDNNWIGDE